MPIRKLLVANRGEIALRVFRACRALGIGTVAVVAPDDRGSLHARSADETVEIASYLHSEEHVRAARATGADAIHPGYGFLAESPAFADDRVFCERFVERPRHVEIQLLGDDRDVIALGERECSIQRRHQKVLEEAPSAALDAELRARMEDAAVAFARAIGYRSAGTAEFMLDERDFFFLELNGRIQVEHPVTELVTGADHVQAQLRIAAGEPLDVRSELRARAVEVRLYAEDPRSFLPQAGR